MLATKSYIGCRLDMQHYKGVVMQRTIEVFDIDEEAYALTNDDVFFEVFAKPHGKSLDVFNLGEQTDNLISLDGQVLDHRTGIYYHECYQLQGSPSEKLLLFYGVSEII